MGIESFVRQPLCNGSTFPARTSDDKWLPSTPVKTMTDAVVGSCPRIAPELPLADPKRGAKNPLSEVRSANRSYRGFPILLKEH